MPFSHDRPESPPPAPRAPLKPPFRGGSSARLGHLEQQMAVVEHRLDDIQIRHETVPTRVTRLEQGFEHMAGQLTALNAGQAALTVVVSDIGKKITWALAIASTLWAILQMVGPTLLRGLFP